MHIKHSIITLAILSLLCSLLLCACTNINPIDKPPYSTIPPSDQSTYLVTYNYGDQGPVQLSNNNITLKVGQRLVLQPAAGFTGNTHFTSSGDYFWGNIMQQEGNSQTNATTTFKAIKAGKGKLSIIPNTNETDRAVDLWVTVQ